VSVPAPREPAARLVSVGIDSPDPVAAARWWADALGWTVVAAADDEAEIAPPGRDREPVLVFLAVPEAKTAKNRLHLDLGTDDADDHRETVARLLAAGATRVDVGQRDATWDVLADPDGNELCVLEPRDRYRGAGRLAAVVVDAADPARLARWWADASGWTVGYEAGGVTSLHHPGDRPPDIDFVTVTEPKEGKNRLHLDLLAPAGDVEAEVRRLVARGARRVDIGQGDVPWAVLADPEGNEFCVLPSPDL
jgi:predicted enzyme related to lactoylglutathione lyase